MIAFPCLRVRLRLRRVAVREGGGVLPAADLMSLVGFTLCSTGAFHGYSSSSVCGALCASAAAFKATVGGIYRVGGGKTFVVTRNL